MKKGFLSILFIFVALSSNLAHTYTIKNGPTYVFADILKWKLSEGSAVNWAQVITPSGTTQTSQLIDAPFKWDTGFRIGIGYDNSESWNTTLYYTSFDTTATNQATGRVYSSFLGNFFANNTSGSGNGPFYSNAEIQWKVVFRTLDFEIARIFKNENNASIRPFIGLKTAVINQKLLSNWQNPSTTILGIDVPITTFSTATENIRNNFFGIGPSFGVNFVLPIFKRPKDSFNVIGNLSGAFLLGHWSMQDIYQNNTPLAVTVDVSNINGVAPVGKGVIGMDWAHQFTKATLDVSLSYEAQIWRNQLQYYSFNMGRLHQSLSLQGGVLNFALTF